MENIELVSLKGNDVFTDTMVVAKGCGNEHESVVLHLKKYKADFEEFGEIRFTDLKSGNSKGGRPSRIYQLNEMQATLLITYLDNTKRVRDFKKELVRQFFEMRRFILERQTSQWMETRDQGKLTRKAETDTIQKLVEYAASQGSKNSGKLYVVYSKLANEIAGVSNRDQAAVNQLNNLSLIENIILHCIESGISEEKHYKEIYKDCKKRLLLFKDLAYLTLAG